MRILHVLTTRRLSGAEGVAADICAMFADRCDMIYCSPEGPIREALNARDVRFLPLAKAGVAEVRQAIKRVAPDIIHAHDVRATVLAVLCGGSIPVISHLHGNAPDMRRITLKSVLYAFSARRVERVLVVSPTCLRDYVFRHYIERRAVILRNVVNPKRIALLASEGREDYRFDFVYVGRLDMQKDPERIARVASGVLHHCPTARFGVIGDGAMKQRMQRIFESEGVAERVTFTGRLNPPYSVLRRAKCLLMCSHSEGTPIVALEAMVLGVPIVSTPVDGMLELVEEGVTGYLSNDDAVLASRVAEIVQDQRLRARLSANSQNKVKQLVDYEGYRKVLWAVYSAVYPAT